MGIHLFHTMNEYIKHLNDIEKDIFPTFIASSYLSSYLFSKSIILRFFERDLNDDKAAKEAANDLWHRKKMIYSNMTKIPYKEMYEIEAFEAFCQSGIVHKQVPNFKATPKEIIELLQLILTLLRKQPLYEVAFCRKVLPFIFIVKSGKGLTIDVINNYGYQSIQGLYIDDDHIVAEFQKEFNQIWNDKSTISNREQIISLIEKKIDIINESSHLFA